MAARQEEGRRKTAQYEAELRTKTEIAKAKAETEGRISQERMNHDLILEKVRLEALEYRDTALKAIQDGGKLIGEGLSSYLNDTQKLRNTALTVTGIAVGIYTARTSISIAGRFVEARLGKPSLVRETSRLTATQFVREPLSSSKRLLGIGVHEQDALKGIVLEEGLDTQLRKIAVSTAHTKKNRAPFRHLLLHGTYVCMYAYRQTDRQTDRLLSMVRRFAVTTLAPILIILLLFSSLLQDLRERGKPCLPGNWRSIPVSTMPC
jgi:ATPase family AAA domain-containing protein 3A/B